VLVNVTNGSFAEPNLLVVARHRCLARHHHGSTVALQSHAGAGFLGLSHHGLIAKEIHRGLVVQKYDLPEVKLDSGGVSLLEKLRDPWFEFFIELRELEFAVHLKVRRFEFLIELSELESAVHLKV
jgi:hypothetical protein